MGKNTIIADLANGVASLKISLTRTLVIARRLGNKKFSSWVEKELYGYSIDDDIPPYRNVYGHLMFSFNNGYQEGKNVPLPYYALPKEYQEFQFRKIYDGIETIEHFVSEHKSMIFSFPELVPFLKTNRALNPYDVKLEISDAGLIKIKNLVEKELLNILLEISSKVEDMDDLDPKLDEISKENINKTINVNIDRLLSIGSNNDISRSSIVGGDSNGK